MAEAVGAIAGQDAVEQAARCRLRPGAIFADLRARGMLFPSQAEILETEITTATRVAEFMFDKGLAQVERSPAIRPWIERQLCKPQY